ncbi:kinesin-like protein KIF11 [Lampris incognitus]|uniref:kinesin-like protein KIF11 n=1 Tax=Lampris incognitus TaxID=2546036 RepID=UPI0024B5F337|nr:kinesin-like protein KIF11 [Lampris incognitus]
MSSQTLNSSKREEKGRNIQVVVRCRPLNTVERKTSFGVMDCDVNKREVIVRTGGMNDKLSRKTYTFDMVFGQAAKQIDVYRSVLCPILDEVIMGYNCTVFAYGQTGTGKTFTMEGARSLDEEFTWEEDPLAGIIPRTLHQIFEKLSENGTEFSVKVSLLEIYNEELFDLLSPSDNVTEKLQLFDDPRNKRGVLVKGLEEVTVHNKDEVYQILERGAAKRKTASTLLNAYSSRSHSVFSITIHMREITLDGEELVKIGKLNLVDLAGSENIGRSGAVDKRAREAGNINQSLLTLGRVITALVEKRPHVPYRESKLTRILQDSLGGRTKTSIIATVSPSSSNLEETLSTLEYASRAKNILNKPEVNQKLTKKTLIKEYTEEIERLKRDLAATREKNGVYMSAENYENMMGQVVSREEQMLEYTERIAVMEEELKRVTELFAENKNQLEKYANNLHLEQQRLEETHQDLQQTKKRLKEEEIICSELSSTQKALYNTAEKLLNTVDASTSDVSGLHEKLARKTKVENHNMQIQQSFAQRMDEAFKTMQHSIQQQGVMHHNMINTYSMSIDGVLVSNEAAWKGAQTTVESLVDGVRQLVAEGVASFQAKVQQQEALSQQNRESLLKLLEDHGHDMEDALVTRTLKSLSAIGELNGLLRSTVQTQRALADKLEDMEQKFFNGFTRDLEDLREQSVQGLNTLQSKIKRQDEEIQRAEERHQTSMMQTINCLQNQLNLLAHETQKDFAHLRSASSALWEPVETIQNDINTRCGVIESKTLAQMDLFSSTTASLASAIRQDAQDSEKTLGEIEGYCSYLCSSVTELSECNQQWCSDATHVVDTQAQEQLSLLGETSAAAQALQQEVENHCNLQLVGVQTELTQHLEVVHQTLVPVQKQVYLDRVAIDKLQAELQNHVETDHRLVLTFLEQELRQDVPTGATPQRREFVYPKLLVKSQHREEILESLRLQQEELQDALNEKLEEEEKSQDKNDSLDLSPYDDSEAAEPCDANKNVACSDNRLPFFRTKISGKENMSHIKPKATENEAVSSPQKSKLPLRCQN